MSRAGRVECLECWVAAVHVVLEVQDSAAAQQVRGHDEAPRASACARACSCTGTEPLRTHRCTCRTQAALRCFSRTAFFRGGLLWPAVFRSCVDTTARAHAHERSLMGGRGGGGRRKGRLGRLGQCRAPPVGPCALLATRKYHKSDVILFASDVTETALGCRCPECGVAASPPHGDKQLPVVKSIIIVHVKYNGAM